MAGAETSLLRGRIGRVQLAVFEVILDELGQRDRTLVGNLAAEREQHSSESLVFDAVLVAIGVDENTMLHDLQVVEQVSVERGSLFSQAIEYPHEEFTGALLFLGEQIHGEIAHAAVEGLLDLIHVQRRTGRVQLIVGVESIGDRGLIAHSLPVGHLCAHIHEVGSQQELKTSGREARCSCVRKSRIHGL